MINDKDITQTLRRLWEVGTEAAGARVSASKRLNLSGDKFAILSTHSAL